MSVEMGLNRESCLSKGLAQKIGLTRKGTLNRAFTIFVPSKQWRKFSFLSGGARAINFLSREKCFCSTYFAERPDVNRVLKCAKRIGISDFTTI